MPQGSSQQSRRDGTACSPARQCRVGLGYEASPVGTTQLRLNRAVAGPSSQADSFTLVAGSAIEYMQTHIGSMTCTVLEAVSLLIARYSCSYRSFHFIHKLIVGIP
jgi:hypothetical protein